MKQGPQTRAPLSPAQHAHHQQKPAPTSATLWEATPPSPTPQENPDAPRSCRSPRAHRLTFQQREAERLTTGVVRLRYLSGKSAYTQDVTLTLRDGDCAPRIKEVARVRGLQHLLIRRQRKFGREQLLAHLLVIIEVTQQHRHVRQLEVVSGLLHLVLVVHVAIGDGAAGAIGPDNVIDALDALQIHRKTLEAVGDLARHRSAVQPADL